MEGAYLVSENLIRSVAPYLAPPVARERIHSASEADEGARLAIFGLTIAGITFADDDAE